MSARRGARLAAPLVAALLLVGPMLAASTPLAAQEPGDAAAASETEEATPLGTASWLAGCWEASSPDGRNTVEEHWMAPRGGMMLGLSRTVRDGAARGHEYLAIRETEAGLVYHAAPSGQAPTDFSSRSIGADELEFVNPEHDFPQKIVYRRLGPDAVRAEVFAEADDSEPAFALPYGRVRCPGR